MKLTDRGGALLALTIVFGSWAIFYFIFYILSH